VNSRRLDFKLLIVFVLCLCPLACVREETDAGSLSDKLPFGQVLEPADGAVISGPVTVRGWALSEYGIQDVAIYEDRNFLANAKLGLSSPEAQQQQPGFSGSANAGWRFDADPGIFTNGRHELTIQARSKTGAVRELASLKVVIGGSLGVIDEPKAGAQLAGAFRIGGWALSKQGVDQVMILVDGKFIANAHLGGERPDVQAVYPQLKDSFTSGWYFDAASSMFTPGNHEITVQIRSKAGAVRELGRVKVTIGK